MPKYIAIPTADGTSLTNAKMIDGETAFSGLLRLRLLRWLRDNRPVK